MFRSVPISYQSDESAPTDQGFEIHSDWLEGGDLSLLRLGIEMRLDWNRFPRDSEMIFMRMPLGVRIVRHLRGFPGLTFCHFIRGSLAAVPPAPPQLLRRLRPLKPYKESEND